MFAALESSWTRLFVGIIIGFFMLGILLASFFAGASCIVPGANFGRIILLVVSQLLTGPGYLEMSGIAADELSDTCIFIGVITSAMYVLLMDCCAGLSLGPEVVCGAGGLLSIRR